MSTDSIPFSILIVDDDPSVRVLVPNLLRDKGFQVMTAANGTEGVSVTREHRPDLVLLDVNMPQESGFDVCRKLKNDQDTRDIPIVFMTSLGHDSDRITGFEAGGDDYVIKPCNYLELIARIRRYVIRKSEKCRYEHLRQLIASCSEQVESILPNLAPGHARLTLMNVLEDLHAVQTRLEVGYNVLTSSVAPT